MYEKHREGQVIFLRPPLQKVPTTNMPVFYNPKSELNRDSTIGVISAFIQRYEKKAIRACTPLAGTGVRALRIAKEIKGIDQVIAGDANPLAVELIMKNRELNHASDVVEVHHTDANQLLSQYSRPNQKFDIIDVDPFGSPREFFSSAINSLKNHALLCLTATDMPVLVGIRRRTCIKRYAAEPAKTDYAHELAVRILLGCVIREAGAQDVGLQPLITFSIDHYIRLYCEAMSGDESTWNAISQLGFLRHCNECGDRGFTQGLIPISLECPKCHSSKIQQAGPLWIGPLAERVFIQEVIQQIKDRRFGTKRRLLQLLIRINDEIDGPPTYYDLHKLCDRLGIPIPAFSSIIKALRSKGYFCSRTHFSPHAIRTSATQDIIEQVLHELNLGD